MLFAPYPARSGVTALLAAADEVAGEITRAHETVAYLSEAHTNAQTEGDHLARELERLGVENAALWCRVDELAEERDLLQKLCEMKQQQIDLLAAERDDLAWQVNR